MGLYVHLYIFILISDNLWDPAVIRRYCCTGKFGTPQACKPTAYSRIFKTACPKAYSYAYDDPSSIATCTRGNYVVTFCPHHR